MQNSVKVALIAAGSFIAGYVVANARNNAYYLNQANDEIADVKAHYENRIAECMREIPSQTSVKLVADDPELLEAAEALVSYKNDLVGFVPVDVHEHAPKIQYSDYSNVESETPSKPEDKKLDGESQNPVNVEIITLDDFTENDLQYMTHTLDYFPNGDVLMDESSVSKIEGEYRQMILGRYDGVLSRDGFWENLKADEWYLRNHDLKYDYEIIRTEGTFEDEYGTPGENE